MSIYDSQPITRIETDLPNRRGPRASIKDYVDRLQDVGVHLDSFYDNVVLKKHKWNARKARDEEYKLIANRLLQLVGGSMGAKREASNKVIIGVGLGKFSTKTRLSSLHESFQSYFVQKARSLGYIVVGVIPPKSALYARNLLVKLTSDDFIVQSARHIYIATSWLDTTSATPFRDIFSSNNDHYTSSPKMFMEITPGCKKHALHQRTVTVGTVLDRKGSNERHQLSGRTPVAEKE